MKINAAYYLTGLADKISEKVEVGIVGTFEPQPMGFGKFKRGVKPEDLAEKP